MEQNFVNTIAGSPASNASDLVNIFAIMGMVFWVLLFLLIITTVVAMWHVYVKAGRSGWESIIPIYNVWVLIKIARKPGWWFILTMGVGVLLTVLSLLNTDQSPIIGAISSLFYLVNLILNFAIMNGLASNFGKGIGFTVGLIVLQPIFMMILGFGKAQYIGMSVATTPMPPVNPPANPPAPTPGQ